MNKTNDPWQIDNDLSWWIRWFVYTGSFRNTTQACRKVWKSGGASYKWGQKSGGASSKGGARIWGGQLPPLPPPFRHACYFWIWEKNREYPNLCYLNYMVNICLTWIPSLMLWDIFTIFDPYPPPSGVFYYYLSANLTNFWPLPLQIANVLNGWSLYCFETLCY